ncbi:MAG: type II secretion system F family protein [Patescibacteria group bacterium]|nr:type II secretion system F family protein [Patescibacteria group bacterium]
MPFYFYKAKSLKGESDSGVFEAKNKRELARILRKEGYILISAIEKDNTKKKIRIDIPFLNKVGLKEKIFFTRNLQFMISAGISLPRALKILSAQTKTKKFCNILLKIADEITKGNNFSDVLSHYPRVFPIFFQNMVRSGEETGKLEDVLKTLTSKMEKEQELKSKIVGAMIYPAVIVFAMTGIGILMLIIIVPLLSSAFEEMNVELPLTTKMVIGFATFLKEKWFLFVFIIFGLIFFIPLISKNKKFKRAIDFLILKIPIISSFIKKTNSALMLRSLSALISSGVPIIRALKITSRSLSNVYFLESIEKTAKKVSKGGKLSDALALYENLYPMTVIQMMKVGEETGRTSDLLMKLADFYEEEVTVATKNLSTVIEPVLMLLVGAAVGLFAISMIQPIYGIMGTL